MKKHLSKKEKIDLLETLRLRFEKNSHRHIGLNWAEIEKRLQNDPKKLFVIFKMELTGGEPDVIAYDEKENFFIL